MAYYILVRRVTLLSAFAFSWAMTVIYWTVFPVWVLTDALPPWIWWFVAWLSHMVFVLGLWMAPKILEHYRKAYTNMASVSTQTQKYQRSWKTTLFAILASQGFGLMYGAAFFGYVVTSQPPSIYPVFGYGKPPRIVIEGLCSYYWAIVGAMTGFIFLYLALRSRKASSLATQK